MSSLRHHDKTAIQAFDSIAGNTVVPYRSLKKLWSGHDFAARSCHDLDL